MKILSTQRGFRTILGRGRVFTLPRTLFSKSLTQGLLFEPTIQLSIFALLSLSKDLVTAEKKKLNLALRAHSLVHAHGIFACYWVGTMAYLSLIFQFSDALTLAYIFFFSVVILLFSCVLLVLGISYTIPTITGGTYSPDFMYVVTRTSGEKELNVIVETKDVENKTELRGTEEAKIKCAELFFSMLEQDGYKVYFKTQINNKQMKQIIDEVLR